MKEIKELVEVTWLDAVGYGRDKDFKEEDLNNKPSKLLEETRTYGYIHSKDSSAISIIHEVNSDDKEFTIIPINWIKKIKRYKHEKKERKIRKTNT